MKNNDISDATKQNWKRLKTQSTGRLTNRANKKKSEKRVIPVERCSNPLTENFIAILASKIELGQFSIESVLFSLCLNLFIRNDISNSSQAARFLKEYAGISVIKEFINIDIPSEFDILGTIYQSLLSEGEKNQKGSYYTPKFIVEAMLDNKIYSSDMRFLDPCCGSGAFLLCVEGINPRNIYGCDIDSTSVMIAKANLILKYKSLDENYYPNVVCLNFLSNELFDYSVVDSLGKFDLIATNPPWGASNSEYVDAFIKSGESSSQFFVKSYFMLKEGGKMAFLLPISILNVKTHKDIRAFMLNNGSLNRITVFTKLFSGVTTQYVNIEHSKTLPVKKVEFISQGRTTVVNKENLYKTEAYTFTNIELEDEIIINKIKNKGTLTLKDSLWALGIVTGDNENKLHDVCGLGEEKIYTGKEISTYRLLEAKKYILFDRKQLQQVAKDYFYRCEEKLIYKFISKRLVFAYDNTGSLFLNSANILIPKIEGMSIKTVMAFLNSPIFQYLYIKLFDEIKILKGNLCMLPFPKLSPVDDETISKIVDGILGGNDDYVKKLDIWMKNFYSLTNDEMIRIKGIANGKTSSIS